MPILSTRCFPVCHADPRAGVSVNRMLRLSIKIKNACLISIWLAFAIINFGEVTPIQAQRESFGVTITSPLEQETFYAGPSSLVYSINVTGKITGVRGDPSVVAVRLDIFQGARLSQSVKTNPSRDGSFTIDFTVNPEGSDPVFTVDMVTRGCSNIGPNSQCHYRAAYSLPRGRLVLRVTAEAPGLQATAERHITVDCSKYINVPVQVVLADQPEKTVANVPVIGSTWLYVWRARSTTGATASNGIANVPNVEVLSEASTIYVFRVDPSVVNGILYKSVKDVEVTLPPGATSAPMITLQVRGQTGKLNGSIKGVVTAPIVVHAILLPSGKKYSTVTSSAGTFEFPNLPIGSYLVMADDRALAAQGYAGKSQSVDLLKSPSATITLPITSAERGALLKGIVRDAKGSPLPFAWVLLEKTGRSQSNMPDSGTYTFTALPKQSSTAIVSAPGYYYLAQVLDASADTADFVLTRRPETKTIAWGTGEINVPPETQLTVESHQITLEYGWLWGEVKQDRSLTLRVADAEIVFAQGKFAIEYLPPNSTGWLYILGGNATVRSYRNPEPFDVRAGEMVAMIEQSRWSAVPIDATAITILQPENVSPIEPVWESTLEAQVRDRLAQMGIGTAQIITLITYSLVIFVFVIAPISIIIRWITRRAKTSV